MVEPEVEPVSTAWQASMKPWLQPGRSALLNKTCWQYDIKHQLMSIQ